MNSSIRELLLKTAIEFAKKKPGANNLTARVANSSDDLSAFKSLNHLGV